jgi:hypothetical protein
MIQQPRQHRRSLLIVAIASLALAFALGAGIFYLGGEPGTTSVGTPTGAPAPTAAAPTATERATPDTLSAPPSAEPTPAPSRDLVAGLAPRTRQREGAMTRATPTPAAPVGGTAAGPNHRVATRVVVPALGIDLPVMPQRTSYPACNVAMYLAELSQPGQGGPTYLYAHARAGMFLALLSQSQISDGANMIGMQVHVYTGDNRVFTYRIDEVRRHTTDLEAVFARGSESLWLQTSEGPRGTIPKLQVGAHLVSSGPASHAASHPVPRPVAC